MIQAGIVLIAVAAGMAIRVSGGVPDDASRWTREHHQAAREFAKVTLAVATVLGIPLLVGGLARSIGLDPAGAWLVAGTLAFVGGQAVRALWDRSPERRPDSDFWDREARIGDGDRRRSVVVLALALVFVLACAALLAFLPK